MSDSSVDSVPYSNPSPAAGHPEVYFAQTEIESVSTTGEASLQDDESSNNTSSSHSSLADPRTHTATWVHLGKMCISLFNLVWRIVYQLSLKAIMMIICSVETPFSKFIVRPLFSLWHFQWHNSGIHIVNAWDNDQQIQQTMRKTTRFFTFAFFTLLCAWIYVYVNPGMSPVGTFPYLAINNVYQQFKLDLGHFSYTVPYQLHVGGMYTIYKRLASIDSKLAEQEKRNIEIASILDTHHDELQTIKTNHDYLAEMLQKKTNDLTEQNLALFSQEGELIVSSRFIDSLRSNRFFKQLARHDSGIAGRLLFRDFKRLMVTPEEEEKIALDYLEGEVSPHTHDYALERNGATIFYNKNMIKMPTNKWGFFNFRVSTWVEYEASSVLRTGDDCWAFDGPIGILGIRLADTAYLKYISVKHTSIDIESAPREFEVDGVMSFSDNGTVPLGKFEFKKAEPGRTQYFLLKREGPLKAIFIKIKSNWGSKDRTDICRIGAFSY